MTSADPYSVSSKQEATERKDFANLYEFFRLRASKSSNESSLFSLSPKASMVEQHHFRYNEVICAVTIYETIRRIESIFRKHLPQKRVTKIEFIFNAMLYEKFESKKSGNCKAKRNDV